MKRITPKDLDRQIQELRACFGVDSSEGQGPSSIGELALGDGPETDGRCARCGSPIKLVNQIAEWAREFNRRNPDGEQMTTGNVAVCDRCYCTHRAELTRQEEAKRRAERKSKTRGHLHVLPDDDEDDLA